MKKAFLLGVLLILVTAFATGAGFQDLFNQKGKVAIIQMSGSIGGSGGILSADSITPSQLRDLNERAISQNADAVVYEINSGGGAVVASKEMMREIDSVEVPTVCRFRDITASGAYLASLGCDHLVADSSSVTGSIGVQASYLEYSGLLDRLGIEYVNVTAGRHKDTGSKYRNITDEESQILKEKTQTVHEDFLSLVDKRRNLTESQLSEVRTGEIFLGTEAEELGLVDSLGGRQEAVEKAEDMTDRELETFRVESRQPFSLVDFFLSSVKFSMDSGTSPLRAVY